MTPDNESSQPSEHSPHPRLARWLARPSPPVWLGITVAAILIVLEAMAVKLLEDVSHDMIFGAVFLFGVLVISAGWDSRVAVSTTVVSTAVYLYMHVSSDNVGLPLAPHDAIAVAVFLPVALLANLLAGQARQRAAEARRATIQARELADRQSALRRVATLVARGVTPSEVLTAVVDEVADTLGTGAAALFRFLDDGTAELVAVHNDSDGIEMPIGTRLAYHDLEVHSRVGAPITVDGRVWGTATVRSTSAEPLPPDTEGRLTDFAELVGTAIANAEARRELIASRARIVAAGDEARRRIERDLHDGAQQRLVAVGLQLRTLQARLPADDTVTMEIAKIGDNLASAGEELRQISHGIHPTALFTGGLRPALRALGRRASIPVSLTINVPQRLPESVEVAAYYIVAEALTNATKHARASLVAVSADAEDTLVRLSVSDDGIGGASLTGGSGLVGLRDRVEALGGQLRVSSADTLGTTLSAEIPFPAAS